MAMPVREGGMSSSSFCKLDVIIVRGWGGTCLLVASPPLVASLGTLGFILSPSWPIFFIFDLKSAISAEFFSANDRVLLFSMLIGDDAFGLGVFFFFSRKTI